MPPRIPSSSGSSQALLHNLSDVIISSSSARLSSAATTQQNGLLLLAGANSTTSIFNKNSQGPSSSASTRAFSTTQPREITRQRKLFWKWLRTSGRELKDVSKPLNYVQPMYKVKRDREASDKEFPFPLNPEFRSQPVLSEEARETIWRNVMVDGQPLKVVSARYSVDMRRVAAVLRMKAVEKQWEAEGKPLAKPYANAVLRMVPTTRLGKEPHEPINDVHVHSYTMQQVFHPTSESREFTRWDAAKAFGEHILPVDKKMRIPELLGLERELAAGVDRAAAEENFTQAALKSERDAAARDARRLKKEEEKKTRVESGRFEFRFEDVDVEGVVGRTGRGRKAVGWRYGAPYTDRKKGMVKIPTKVE